MNPFDTLFGNSRQKAYFSSRIREGTLAHAYILEAPVGSGKKMFSLSLAAAIAAAFRGDEADEREKKCARILSGTSPDVMMLKREEGKKTIGVDAVRDFMSTVYLTPSELSFKMYIFDEADLITPQAQNALLKVIEEPAPASQRARNAQRRARGKMGGLTAAHIRAQFAWCWREAARERAGGAGSH